MITCEPLLPKLRVASSNLVSRSLINSHLASLLGGCFAFGLQIGLHKCPHASLLPYSCCSVPLLLQEAARVVVRFTHAEHGHSVIGEGQRSCIFPTACLVVHLQIAPTKARGPVSTHLLVQVNPCINGGAIQKSLFF